jgi:hypothetical protein
MTRATRLRDLLPAVIRLYCLANTREEERLAYQLMIALGVPPAYGEER